MDHELRKWLKEFAMNLLNALSSDDHVHNDNQCCCERIFKDISKKLHEVVQTFPVGENRSTEQSPNTSDVQVSESPESTPTTSHMVTRRSRSRTPKSSTNANVVETSRSKRKNTSVPRSEVSVKLQRLDVEKISLNNRRKSIDVLTPAKSDALNENEGESSTNANSKSNATKKRLSKLRKTIDTDRLKDIDNEHDKSKQVKNIDRNIFYANTLYRRLCIYCNKNTSRLVPHYKKDHADNEVVISRPSPAMSDSIRLQDQRFDSHRNKITGLCFFCEQIKSQSKDTWMKHLLSHTGELLYHCTNCKTGLKDKNVSHCKQPKLMTIFEYNDPMNGTLTGFMCKECNYVQISKKQMINHLREQHELSNEELIHYSEKITLVPDLRPIRSNFEYKFIKDDLLYKCNICDEQLADIDEFQVHFDSAHIGTPIHEYKCPCGQIQKLNGSILYALPHMSQHSESLFKCMSCTSDTVDKIYYFESGMLKHLATNHMKDKWKFHYLNRSTGKETNVIETAFKKFICNVCNMEFKHVQKALHHFKKKHSVQLIDFKAIVMKTKTIIAGKMSECKTSCMFTSKDYLWRQSFLCTSCEFMGISKENLLNHHNEKHASTMFEFKLGDPMLIHLKTHPRECEKLNEKFDGLLVYSCFWCYNHNNGRSYITGTAEEIHQHWLTEHSKQTEEKFRFYVEHFVKCYCCDVISTYRGMQEHFEKKHSNDQHKSNNIYFVNVNDGDKCPMCNSASDDLRKHIDKKHSEVLKLDMFNPNRLKPEEIRELLAIDVYQKPMCNYCGEIFELDDECQFHNAKKHAEMTPSIRNVNDNELKGLLSACCDEFIRPLEFFNHLNSHDFQFACNKCNLKFTAMEMAAHHDASVHEDTDSLERRHINLNRTLCNMFNRTELCFGNGLVLYKHNVLNTKFDDRELFRRFLRTKNEESTMKFNELVASASEH